MFSFTEAQLYALVNAWIWPFLRISAFVSTAPILSHPAIPRRVKAGMAILITVLIAPQLASISIEPYSGSGVMALMQQLAVGIVMGYGARIVFSAVELAGDLIGMQMGLGFASFLDPQRNAPSPLLATFLMQVTTLCFLALNGHLVMLSGLRESFDLIPIANNLNGFHAASWSQFAQLGSIVFMIGLHIALPILAVVLALNLFLGILSRSAQQLNLFSLGFSVTLLGGLIGFVWALPILVAPLDHLSGLAGDMGWFLH